MKSNRISLASTVIVMVGLATGCAQTPTQTAMDYRRAFNGALETIHSLHVQGKLTAQQEQQLLPAITAASSALDQMDAQAAAGNQSAFNSAVSAFQAANTQISAITAPTIGAATAVTAPTRNSIH